MFIELVDALRCPVPHAESWLVLAALRTEARHVVTGTLGCPVCGAEYPIEDGAADFRQLARDERAAVAVQADRAIAMRMAALMDLTDARGFALLLGAWGSQADALAEIVETPLVLIDPPAVRNGAPGISVVRTDGGAIPLAPAAARASAIDGGAAGRTESAVRSTKPRGRVIAFAATPLPSSVKELARDESMWVGEREPDHSPLVSLHVRRAQ